MATVGVEGSAVGTELHRVLMCDDMQPGSEIGYQTAKAIYLYHPLGAKMADAPIRMAQSQARQISIGKGPEDRVRTAFVEEWTRLGVDRIIANVARTSRIYGIGSVAMGCKKFPPSLPIPAEKLAGLDIFFNVLDPLNTSGNGAANQDPNADNFQRVTKLTVGGVAYHPSRGCILLNEEPVYISFSNSAFGFVGRSVYQRALFPLKTFIQTMKTDDLITRKAGVLVAKVKDQGSRADRIMAGVAAVKRLFVKDAITDDVLSIGHEDTIESLDLQGIEGAAGFARKNSLENTAVAADMPAQMLNSETFAEGFGEGTEDAKKVASFVDRIRIELQPLYVWFDNIVQYRAWTPEFYETIRAEFPDDYADVDFNTAFYQWRNSFQAKWPSLLTEPDSEKSKTEDVKLKAIVAVVEVLEPTLDPENKVALIQWVVDNLNSNKLLFPHDLVLDFDALRDYVPPAPPPPPTEPGPPEAFGGET